MPTCTWTFHLLFFFKKTLYFVFADGSYITGHYDEEQSWKFWLDLDGGSLRLVMGDEWLSSDFVKE